MLFVYDLVVYYIVNITKHRIYCCFYIAQVPRKQMYHVHIIIIHSNVAVTQTYSIGIRSHHPCIICFDSVCLTKTPVTPGLRPGYDLPATEKWANRRKNVRLVAEVVRLVAEVVGDRKGQIRRNKIVVMFKTRSHRAYDQVPTYL